MLNRCIGIDINSSFLRAVQASRADEQYLIEKEFSTKTQIGADSPSDILRTLVNRHGFDRRAAVAVSVSNDTVFFRSLETDFAGFEQIRKRDLPALEHNFPIKPDQIVAQICSYRRLAEEKYSVLTAAVTRDSLRERLDTLGGAKMIPDLVETVIFAIHSTITVNHPEIMTGKAIIAYIDDSFLSLAVTENNTILIVRNVPIVCDSDNNTDSVQKQIAKQLSNEVKITWRKIFEAEIDENPQIYLAAQNGISIDLQAELEKKLPCHKTIINPYAKVGCSHEHNGDTGISVAEGLALRLLAPDKTTGVNFLEAKNASIKPALDLKREFKICAILAAAIALVSFVGLFVRLSRLETKYANLKNEIEKVFQSALPEETKIVEPLAQLEQKLQSLQSEFARLGPLSGVVAGPLEILRTITTEIPPKAGITIHDALITAESVRLTGTSTSFESVYSWQHSLQQAPQFLSVDVRHIGTEPKSELVQFTIVASLSNLEQ
jgi:Tfp pilus assembly PilM family ATPase